MLKWSGGGVGRNGGAQKWGEESQTNTDPMVLGLKSTERAPGQLVKIHRLLGGWVESEILQLVYQRSSSEMWSPRPQTCEPEPAFQ